MKKCCQVGTGQLSCGEQRRQLPYAIVGRKRMKEVGRLEKDKGGLRPEKDKGSRQVGTRYVVK